MIPRVRVYIPTINLLVRLKIEKDRKPLSTNVSKTSKAGMIRVNTRNAPESQPWNGNRHFKESALFREVKLPNRGQPQPPAEQIAGLDLGKSIPAGCLIGRYLDPSLSGLPDHAVPKRSSDFDVTGPRKERDFFAKINAQVDVRILVQENGCFAVRTIKGSVTLLCGFSANRSLTIGAIVDKFINHTDTARSTERH